MKPEQTADIGQEKEHENSHESRILFI